MENKNNNIFLGEIEKSGCYVNNAKYGYFLTCGKKNYKIPTTTSIPTPTINEANVQVNYSDGLGRVIQQVAHQQSNSGNDIITHLEYDINGRSEKEFLPYSNQNASLNYNSSANSDVLSFYNTPPSNFLLKTICPSLFLNSSVVLSLPLIQFSSFMINLYNWFGE